MADNAKSGDDMKPATEFEASGAVIEPDAKKAVDMKHPAIDASPRKGTTADSNRIDLNDPTKTQAEAVADNLKKA